MKKIVLAALVAVLSVPTAGASTRAVSPPTCEEPQPVRTYDGEGMTYRIAVDYASCHWWNGSSIQLEATLSRLDGTGEQGSTTAVICGGLESPQSTAPTADDDATEDTASADDDPADDAVDDRADAEDDEGEADDDPADAKDADDSADKDSTEKRGNKTQRPTTSRARDATCEVATGLGHPAVEIARYHGEVTFPWRDGPRTVAFDAICTAPALQCHDA